MMMLFADDMLIIQENEDTPQKSMYELQKISNNYNFNISTTKTKVMAFQVKYPVRSKIILNNKLIIQQVSNFNCLGCNVTYKYDEDLNDKLSKFQNICGVIARTLKKKTRRETNLKFYKIMAVPVLLYGSETWTLRKRDWNTIQAAEMKYLRTVKGCTRLEIRNEDIRNELGISPLSEKIIEYRNKWKVHLQRMEHTRIPLQAYKYQPSGKET
jgi:hypothetical protein